jgi:autotransporter-associated beta strand protein
MIFLAVFALIFVLLGPKAVAANMTWSGNATGNSTWGNGTNWAGIAPVTNDALFFAGSNQLANSNTLTANATFAGITFNSGAGAFTLSGNAITLGGAVTNSSTSAQAITLNMILSATRNFNAASGNLSVAGILSGAGGLTKNGTGILTLSGANTYSGTTTVSAGTLKLGSATALGSTAASTTVSGGALDLNGQAIGNEAIVLSSTASLVNNSGTSASLSGAISGLAGGTIMGGPGNLTLSGVVTSTGNAAWFKTGNGTLTLSGNNTFSRALTISAGAVNIQSSLALGAANTNRVTVNATAALEMQGNITSSSKRLTLNGSGTSNTGALRNISGNNTYGNSITLGSATRINSDAGTLTLNSTTAISGATFGLTVGGAGNTTIRSVIGTTTGTLTKDGAGTLILSAANTYTGLTTVSGGTLAYGANNAISTGLVTVNGGTLDMRTFSDTVGAVTLTSGSIAGTTGVLTGTSYNLNGNGSASAILAGTGVVVKSGAGTTTTLSGNNTFTGITTISGGTLSVGTIGNGVAASNLGNATNVATNLVINGGTLQYTGATLSTNRTFTVGSNHGTIDASGIGALTLTATPTFSANATLTLAGSNTGNNTLSGVIANNGTTSLMKSGAGTWVLTANNTYNGTTTVSGGILEMSGTSATGAINITAGNLKLDSASRLIGAAPALSISSGASLTMAGSESISSIAGAGTANLTSGTLTVGTASGSSTFDGLIAGAGGLAKVGTSTLTLSNNSTYSGGTTITGGQLIVDKGQGLGTGNLTMTGGNATTHVDLNYSASNSTLSVGAVTLNGNSTISLQPNSKIVSTGAVSISGTNNLLSISGSTWGNGTSTLLSGTSMTQNATISLTGQTLNGATLALGGNTTVGRVNYAFSSNLTSLILNTDGVTFNLVWTGGTAGDWNTTSANWQQVGGNSTTFYTNDNVSFTDNATISVTPDAVHAGEMEVSNESGTVTLTGGAISVDDLTKTGAGALVINSNLELADTNGDIYEYLINDGSGNVTIGGVFSGAAGLVQSGNGTLTLSATNTYSEGSTVSDGTLVLGANNALGNGTLSITGGTVNVGSFNQSLLGAVSLTGGNITGTGTLTGTSYAVGSGNISAILSGAAALTKSTNGTVTLTGASTYTGATTINNGTLKYGADNALSSTTAVIINANTGGTAILDLNGFNGTISSLTFGGVDGLAGSVNQVATGSGTLTLGGDVTSVATGNPTGSDTISGKLDLGGATRTFTVGNSGGNFAEMDVLAVVSGSGAGITKAGAGVLVLSGANTYDGATTVNAGLLRLANNSALGTSAGATTVNDGASIGLSSVTITGETMTFIGVGITDPFGAVAGALRNYSGNNTITGSADIGIGSASVLTTRINAYINPTTLTISGTGVVQGAAAGAQTLELYGQALSTGVISRVIQNGSATSLAVTKAEAGLWVLTGNNTYTGGTTISAGTLQIGNGGTSGNLSATGGIVNNGTLSINRSNAVAQGADFSAISGSGSFIQAGLGNTTLTAANTYTGTTTINSGVLKYGADNALASATDMIVNSTGVGSATLDLNGFNGTINSLTFGGVGAQSGSVNQVETGSGTLTLAGNVTSVATGNRSATDTISGKLALGNATRTFAIGDSGSNFAEMEVQAVISGSAVGITKADYGVLVLSGANTYTGETTVDGGLLRLANNSALGSSAGGTTVNDGASIGLAGVTITDENLTLIGLGIVDPAGDVAGALRNYSGNNTITGSGNISIGSASVLTTRITAYINPTTLTLSGAGVVQGAASGDQTLELYGQALSTGIISRIIQNGSATSLSITKAEEGTWVFSGNNTYTGPTNVTAGTLVLGANHALGNGSLTVSGGTLNTGSYSQPMLGAVTLSGGSITGNGTLTGTSYSVQSGSASAVLAGNASLTKSGSGTVTLTGNNTYTGPTNVTAGTLLVNGNQAAATGAVTVASGATLGGTGTLGGATTIAGAVSPGIGGIGTLNVANSVTWQGAASASSSTDWIFQLGASNNSDLLNITGDFGKDYTTYGTTFRFDFGGSTNTGTFKLVDWSGTSSFAPGDFSFTNLGSGLEGSFTINGTELDFSTFPPVPEPATWIAMAALILTGGTMALRRRRNCSPCLQTNVLPQPERARVFPSRNGGFTSIDCGSGPIARNPHQGYLGRI